jgi:RimJ/RimL family protein N-acetyltransferase
VDDDPVAVQLLDGRTVRLRPIAPSDRDALVRFHEGLTLETTRLRFFTVHPQLTPNEVERFTHVDHHEREALVVLHAHDIVAVGRYDRLPETDDAEVAFIVADAWQGAGVAMHLLTQLARQAADEGITRFVADTLCENHRMRAVFLRSGLPLHSESGIGVVQIVLDLPRSGSAKGPVSL